MTKSYVSYLSGFINSEREYDAYKNNRHVNCFRNVRNVHLGDDHGGATVMRESYLMATSEAAEYLFGTDDRSAIQRVVRMCKLGEIPHKKDGRYFWVIRDELEKHLDNG